MGQILDYNIPGDAHLGGRHPIQVVVVLDGDGVVLQQVLVLHALQNVRPEAGDHGQFLK